jgi:3-oxoacyl-[acyl-carrier-protein] synthase-3
MSNFRTQIQSLGHFVPPLRVLNKDLEKLMETTDEWIQQRSGIKERRWVEPGESVSGMAHKASLEALQKAGLKANDVDAIIFATLISDYVFPGAGVMLQKSLGFTEPVPALDLRNQCTGFLYALSVADAWIRSGMYKRVLIACSEIHSTSLDKTTKGRDIAVLFGDGAGSCIVEAGPTQISGKDNGLLDIHIASQGEYAEKLYLSDPSPNSHPRIHPDRQFEGDFYPQMDGRFVFKNAVERMTQSLQMVLARNKMTAADVDFVIAHQANMRINHMVMETLGIPIEKTHHTIDRYGNTTAATIPITMDEAVGKGLIKRGDLVAFVAFGSGFTWGSALLRY